MATYNIDKITLPSGDVCNLTIPDASATQAGKVSTGDQEFAGQKTFPSPIVKPRTGTAGGAVFFNTYDDLQNGVFTMSTYNAHNRYSLYRFQFREHSLSSSTNEPLTNYESFRLPSPDFDRASNENYEIITTKNISDIPDASLTEAGKVTTDTQKFGGQKVFDKVLSINVSSGTGYPMLYFRDEVHHPVDEVGGYASAGIFNVTSDITKNRLGFALWSPKSDGTGYTTKSESFSFPAVDVGRTTNGAYRILTTKETKTYTASLTTAGWSSNAQTVTVTGMTADAIIMVSAAPASEATYRHSGVYCSAQAANSLTFTCASTPTAAITVNILTIG